MNKKNKINGGLYRKLNISVKLLDIVIIGGLFVVALVIMASATFA